jgi:transposase InsO family protein
VATPAETERERQKTPDVEAIVRSSRRAASFARQRARRLREATARRHAIQFAIDIGHSGCSCRRAAASVGLRPRTLSYWRCREQRGELTCRCRGRPCKESRQEDRRCVVELMQSVGPQVGVPALRVSFPTIPRCELADLACDYRHQFRQCNRRIGEVLTWHMPGRVWAMDHAKPLQPIDDVYESLFAVRDLASGMQLAWLPVPDETAETTIAALQALFREHGPPLVLKSDNGPAFKSEDVAELLADWSVVPLRSPPVTPEYNGSCEAGIGTMKVRTHYEAARHGRAGIWNCEDVEVARRHSNEFHYPHGHTQATASGLWQPRLPIGYNERTEFKLALECASRRIHESRSSTTDQQSAAAQQATEHRSAVRQALIELGILTVTWRSIPLPIKPRKSAKIL